MKERFVALGLLSCPAVVFAIFGTSGLDAFEEDSGSPASSLSFEQGMVAFAEECSRCHGRLARGTDRGPNLIHAAYGPGARSDAEFRRAIREGMPARRGYRAMPPTRNLAERRLDSMIAFLRGLQRANGIR